jgi:SnoaL-like domain
VFTGLNISPVKRAGVYRFNSTCLVCRKNFLAFGLLVSTAAILESKVAQENPGAPSIDEALLVFLTAFDNLDWQAFRSCFSPTATIFHPAAPNIRRIDSPDSFVNAWLGVFERIKKSSGRTSPPYMSLNPVDLRVDNLCEDVALVTFHLIDGSTVSRRTLVFKRDSGGWRVVHLHASNITAP